MGRAFRAAWTTASIVWAPACHLPASAVVAPEVIEVLEENAFLERIDEHELARDLEALLGVEVEPQRVRAGRYWRVDLELGPLAPLDLDRPRSAALEGLRSCDLLLAKNAKAQSLGTTLSLEAFTFYDHVGLLELDENGRPWVYESWPRISLKPLGPVFAGRFGGEVARIPLSDFVRRYETVECIRLGGMDEGESAAVLRRARAAREHRIEYDPFHDADDPRLSCSELLVHLLGEAVRDGGALTPAAVSRHRSVRRLLTALGFRTDPYLVPDSFAALPGATSVGTLSRHRDRAGLASVAVAYELLHAHFLASDADVGIGSYVAFDRWQLVRYREATRSFLDLAAGLAAALGPWDQRSEARLRSDLTRTLPLFFRRRDPRRDL